MSATKAKQGGRLQLEQSNLCLASNMAKMAKGWISHDAMVKMQYRIRKHRAGVQDKKMWGVGFHAHTRVKATIEWHLAMVLESNIVSCLPCQNGTRKNPQTCWRCKRPGATPPEPGAPCLECHLRQPVTMRQHNGPKSKVCHPNMGIYILLFPVLNVSILIHMPWIASPIKIFHQICWLMKEHPLVSTLSAMW